MLDQLDFTIGDEKYLLRANGTAVRTSDGTKVTGSWAPAPYAEGEGHRLSIDFEDAASRNVSVSYKFLNAADNSDGFQFENVLEVTVKGDAAEDIAKAPFLGTIKIDDKKDIDYVLEAGGAFVLTGKLEVSNDHRKLTITYPDEIEKGEIKGRPKITKGPANSGADQRDLFIFSAYTAFESELGDLFEKPADIELKGSINFKDNKVVFFGSVGQDTVDIAIAGTYKAIAGALQIISHDGTTTVNLSIDAQIKFIGYDGNFALSLGESETGFRELRGGLNFENPHAQHGITKIQAGLTVTDGGASVELELEGTFRVNKDGFLKFHIKAASGSDKIELDLSGELKFLGGNTVVFDLQYSEGTVSVEISVQSETYDAWVSFVLDEGDAHISFKAVYTFSPSGKTAKKAIVEIPG